MVDAFISDLKQYGLQRAQSNLTVLLINDKIIPALTGIYKRAGLEGARWTLNELRAKHMRPVMKKAGAGFGRNEEWIRQVLKYLEFNILDLAQRITDTMREDILRIISEGIDQGWGIEKMVAQMRSADLPLRRARTIARTEVVRAANVGHAEGAKTFPFEVNKRWSAASDHRTRHSHRKINNIMIDEVDRFKVPVYKGDKPNGQVDNMLHPGDPDGSAANVINCRCRIIHEPKRDGKGQLIRRTTSPATVIPMRQTPNQIPGIGIAARKTLTDNITVDV